MDPSGAVFVCSPREATIIKIKVGPKFDHPVLSTLGLPEKTVACFASAAVASGYQDAPQIETSKTATVHFEDGSPADIAGLDGAIVLLDHKFRRWFSGIRRMQHWHRCRVAAIATANRRWIVAIESGT